MKNGHCVCYSQLFYINPNNFFYNKGESGTYIEIGE